MLTRDEAVTIQKAFHEAGHAFVNVDVGLTLIKVSLERTEAVGNCTGLNRVRSLMAGHIAQSLLSPDTPYWTDLYANDLVHAQYLLNEEARLHLPQPDCANPTTLENWITRTQQHLQQENEDFFQRPSVKEGVGKFVHQLCEQGEMDGPTAYGLIKPWLRPVPTPLQSGAGEATRKIHSPSIIEGLKRLFTKRTP